MVVGRKRGRRKQNKTETDLTKSRYTRCFFILNGAVFFFQHLVLCKIAKANSKEIKQGFRLPHYGFKSVQNLDLFKSVPVYVGTTICSSGESNGRNKLKKTQNRCLPDFLVWLLARCFVWFGELRPRQTSRWLSWRCTFGLFRSVIHIL